MELLLEIGVVATADAAYFAYYPIQQTLLKYSIKRSPRKVLGPYSNIYEHSFGRIYKETQAEGWSNFYKGSSKHQRF